MPGYEYNPLLKLDLQKKQNAATPEDVEQLQSEIDALTVDVANKVPKFFTSIDELEINEIGEYQGDTNETFTNGYFYKRTNALPVEYEDVTIPVGSKKIIYTNLFDSTQKIVYAISTQTLSPSIVTQYSQKGKVWLIDETIHNNIIYTANTLWLSNTPRVIPEQSGLFYSIDDTLWDIYENNYKDSKITGVRAFYEYLQTVALTSGFRLDFSNPGIVGRISDLLFSIRIPVIYEHAGVSPQTDINVRLALASDLAEFNWNVDAYIAQFYETGVENQWCYNNTQDVEFGSFYTVISVGATKYILDNTGGSGQGASEIYRTISADGEYERYIDMHHLTCVFDSKPINTSSYWAQAIDLGIYFDYEAEIEDTTQEITIHRRIITYDEYGFPVVDIPAILRVDTQPSLDPDDFATADQGAKADTALQSISKGTDGDYVTTTVTPKDADNDQSVSVSLKMQAISTSSSSAKGLAESSDVKDYVGTNTATPQQGAKADTALQQVVHGTDGLYVTTTVTQKTNNEQTIYTALKLQDIATADDTNNGVAVAANVRNYLNILAATSEAYGVMWDTANPSPTLTRIGNMQNHALLPVQSQMIGGVMADDGTFTPFDNQADWTQATQARDGSDGQVMVRIPRHWRRCSTYGTYNIVMLSPVEISGYIEVREQYVSAYEASVQRSTLKLSSVNNATADYRGGHNEASWDGTYRTLLNRPVTNLNLDEFRTYARNRGNGIKWNCMTYEAVRTIYWLFVTEYATLNSQAEYTSELDANGCHQGGLGIGVSDWNGTAWNNYNGYAPLIPCGVLDEYGSATTVKNFSIYNADTTLAHTFQCNKYRGIELPFGDIWKYIDGVLINVESGDGVSTAYTTIDTANFSSASVANYNEICNTYRVDSYIKGIVFNANGDIFATQNGANSTSYYCDQYFGANIHSTTELRAWRFGGAADLGAYCGLACALSAYVPGNRSRTIGSRLCFIP